MEKEEIKELNEFSFLKGEPKNLPEMESLLNNFTTEEKFYKPISNYKKYLENIPNFTFDGVFLSYKESTLVGMGIAVPEGDLTKDSNSFGFINILLVTKNYRKKGIGKKLLTLMEEYLKNLGYKTIKIGGHLPSCYAWYIPNTDRHDHPCAPGIPINSDLYLFLLHNRFIVEEISDAFHLNLSEYEISPFIQKILEENEREGVKIEIYDPQKHFGVDEFCKELNIYDFEKVIKENLALKKPFPFLVVNDKGKVVGWTGALWNEESGRGHFDGIAILEKYRGKGLGKALFSLLALNSKKNGAKFMTFYTGLDNYARFIYMGAGFKIVHSFARMKKTYK